MIEISLTPFSKGIGFNEILIVSQLFLSTYNAQIDVFLSTNKTRLNYIYPQITHRFMLISNKKTIE